MEFESIRKNYSEERNIESIVGNLHIALEDFACIHIVPEYEDIINDILKNNSCIDDMELYTYIWKYDLDDYMTADWKEKGASDDAIEQVKIIKTAVFNKLTDVFNKIVDKV